MGFLLSSGPASAQAPTLKAVKVASSVPTMTTAALYLMKSLQLNKKHGLDVEYIQMGGASTLMVDAVLSGNAMFATPGTATALQAIRQGANLRVVGAYANNQIAAVIGKAAMEKTGLTAASPAADKIPRHERHDDRDQSGRRNLLPDVSRLSSQIRGRP